MSNNLKNSGNLAVKDSSTKIGNFAFHHKTASSMKQADHRDMFKKASKCVCTSTVVYFLTPCLQQTQKRTLTTLNEQMKEISK